MCLSALKEVSYKYKIAKKRVQNFILSNKYFDGFHRKNGLVISLFSSIFSEIKKHQNTAEKISSGCLCFVYTLFMWISCKTGC